MSANYTHSGERLNHGNTIDLQNFVAISTQTSPAIATIFQKILKVNNRFRNVVVRSLTHLLAFISNKLLALRWSNSINHKFSLSVYCSQASGLRFTAFFFTVASFLIHDRWFRVLVWFTSLPFFLLPTIDDIDVRHSTMQWRYFYTYNLVYSNLKIYKLNTTMELKKFKKIGIPFVSLAMLNIDSILRKKLVSF